jgi:hypothetical protein
MTYTCCWVRVMMCRMPSAKSEVAYGTYYVEHEGKWYEKTYHIWPLDLKGSGEDLYYCPFVGCEYHPKGDNGKGCSRATMNRHGREQRCKRVTYREPVCDHNGDDEPWFKLLECVPKEAPETHARARYVRQYGSVMRVKRQKLVSLSLVYKSVHTCVTACFSQIRSSNFSLFTHTDFCA